MIDGEQAVAELLSLDPNLQERFERYRQEWMTSGAQLEDATDEEPGLFNVWGDIVFPVFVKPSLDCGRYEDLSPLFERIERMATGGDVYVQAFVRTGACERLVDNPKWWSATAPLMGPTTRTICEDVIRTYWPSREL